MESRSWNRKNRLPSWMWGVAAAVLVVPASASAQSALTINSAQVDRTMGIISILGSFGAAPPNVTLGGTALTVSSAAPDSIVAVLPMGTGDGTYRLLVQDSIDPTRADVIGLTVGVAGPRGPQGPVGPQGPARAPGPVGSRSSVQTSLGSGLNYVYPPDSSFTLATTTACRLSANGVLNTTSAEGVQFRLLLRSPAGNEYQLGQTCYFTNGVSGLGRNCSAEAILSILDPGTWTVGCVFSTAGLTATYIGCEVTWFCQ